MFWHRRCLAPFKPPDWGYQSLNPKLSLVTGLCPKLEPCYLSIREWFQQEGFWHASLGQIYTRKHKGTLLESKVRSITQDKLRVTILKQGSRSMYGPRLWHDSLFSITFLSKSFQEKKQRKLSKSFCHLCPQRQF